MVRRLTALALAALVGGASLAALAFRYLLSRG
jgi:hypothetical protein